MSNIFISWSGVKSKAAAMILFDRLPGILPEADPWISTDSIPSGERWSLLLENAINTAQCSFLAVTSEACASDWMMFEAGALARNNRLVIPLLIDITPNEIPGPLQQFQCIYPTRPDMLAAIKSVHRTISSKTSTNQVSRSFSANWLPMKKEILNINKQYPKFQPLPPRLLFVTSADMRLIRELVKSQNVNEISRRTGVSPSSLRTQVHDLLARTQARNTAELVLAFKNSPLFARLF